METSVTRLEDNVLEVTVSVAAKDVDAYIARAYKEMGKKYRIKGFRAGKVPRAVLDSHLGKEAIRGEATNMLISAEEPAVLEACNIALLGEAQYENIDLVEEGKDYSYVMKAPVKPEFELSSYEPVSITLPVVEPTDEEVDEQVEIYREFFATTKDLKTKRMVKKTDLISVTIVGHDDFTAMDCEDRTVELGKELMPAQLEKEIVGMKPGETKTVTYDLSEDVKVLKGKDGEDLDLKNSVEIDVTVNGIKERELPELTDEFVKQNFDFETLEKMKASIKEEGTKKREEMIDELKERRCSRVLGQRISEDIPENYLSVVFNDMAQNFLTDLQHRGQTLDGFLATTGLSADKFIADLRRQADDVARESLALDAWVRHFNIEVTDEDIDAALAERYTNPEEARKLMTEDGQMPSLRVYLARMKATEAVLDGAQITVVSVAEDKELQKKEAEEADALYEKKMAAAKKEAEKAKKPAKKSAKKVEAEVVEDVQE